MTITKTMKTVILDVRSSKLYNLLINGKFGFIQVLMITFLIMNQIIPMYQVNPETNVLEEGTIKVL